MLIPPSVSSEPDSPRTLAKPLRTWKAKFGDAFRGLKRGVRGQSSFVVHFAFAALVLVAGIVLQCDWLSWCLLILCIGFVLMAELFNSALEELFRGLDEDMKAKTYFCLDIGAGAVLVASITAALVGAIVFLHRLAVILNW